MAADLVICPFCALEFEAADSLCAHGCPLRASCGLLRCPSCDYEFPRAARSTTWLGRLLHRAPPVDPCHRFQPVSDLESGQSATVIALGGGAYRRNALAVFGLVPESEITLVQRRPACVVRVGETELALDPEIAREILVRRPAASLPHSDG
jgi:Fe2+ transport system protein FeoA